jgi:hypothetical protein
MSDHHAAQELLGEFGRSTGLGELALDEDNYCALLIDDGLVINMEFDEQERQLVLYSRWASLRSNRWRPTSACCGRTISGASVAARRSACGPTTAWCCRNRWRCRGLI